MLDSESNKSKYDDTKIPCLDWFIVLGCPAKGQQGETVRAETSLLRRGSTIEEKGKQAYWHEQHKPASEHQCKSTLTRETAYLSVYVEIQPRVSTQTNVICNSDPTI